jgi:hypothetical protein
MYKFGTAIFFFFLGISVLSFSQTTENISIVVIDTETKEPIPFASIHYLTEPTKGWVADLNGIIEIELPTEGIIQNDSLVVKSLIVVKNIIRISNSTP